MNQQETIDLLRPHVDTLSKRCRRAFFRDALNLRSRDVLSRRWSAFFAGFGNAPGIGAAVETFEQAITWGRQASLIYAPVVISSTATDPTNVPTTLLRPGLCMGIITATGQWSNYSASNSDGTQIAQGILPVGFQMVDPFTQLTQTKAWGMLVGGAIKAANIIGLDNNARAQLSPRFLFDDFLQGVPNDNYRFPWNSFVSKTASYAIQPTDNFTLFDNTGAAGPITFTLPPILNGYSIGIRVVTNQNVLVTSNEGANIIALNNASANTLAYQTGAQLIGGYMALFTNPQGTKWILENNSSNAITIS